MGMDNVTQGLFSLKNEHRPLLRIYGLKKDGKAMPDRVKRITTRTAVPQLL